jgi:hypothetical protein
MKKRFIACVVACAMLLMGTGFAYWTDLINLRATARTGYLDVDFVGAEEGSNNWQPIEGGLSGEDAYHSDTAPTATVVNGDNVTLNLDNFYPGHLQNFTATVENNGTLAAKLGKVKMTIGGDNGVTEEMIGIRLTASSTYTTDSTTVEGDPIYGPDYNNVITERCNNLFCHEHFDHFITLFGRYGKKYGTQIIGHEVVTVDGVPTTTPVVINFPEDQTFTLDGVSYVRLSALQNVNVDIADAVANMLYLTNDSSMTFDITVAMDPDAAGLRTTGSAFIDNPNSKVDADTQSKEAWINFGLVWDQYNEK